MRASQIKIASALLWLKENEEDNLRFIRAAKSDKFMVDVDTAEGAPRPVEVTKKTLIMSVQARLDEVDEQLAVLGVWPDEPEAIEPAPVPCQIFPDPGASDEPVQF